MKDMCYDSEISDQCKCVLGGGGLEKFVAQFEHGLKK
jgi:hypothetical protein